MKHGGNAGLGVFVGALLSASAMSLTSFGATPNPYSAIVERNVFNLHAPPPPVNPADLIKKAPPMKITFTGITTILGTKKAFLTIPPVKPGGPPESMILAEGQALNDVEVKSIDEKAQIVQVINHGEPETLDFIHNGATPSGPPPGVLPPPMALPAPIPAPPPPGVQPMPSAGNVIRPLRSLPTRTPGADASGGGLGAAGATGAANQPGQNTLTPEEQVALIELQRYKAIQEHDPISAILPTTELTPEVTGQPAPQAPQ
jgi:hypothetical protein